MPIPELMLGNTLSQLEQQIEVLQELLDLEKQKRDFILAAKGAELKKNLMRSEELSKKFHELEQIRVENFERMAGPGASYAKIHSFLESADTDEAKSAEVCLIKLRTLTFELKTEIEENQELLNRANTSIDRILGSLLKQSEKGKTYSPASGPAKKREAMLLSTSA